MINKRIDELREDIISAVQESVKIKSLEDTPLEGMPVGKGINDSLLHTLKLCENLGFKTKNLDGYVGYAEYGEGEDYIAVLGHLDVVPEGDGWDYAPYGGEIHNGKLYARGAADDKGPIIASLYGLKAIKDLSLNLSKRVRIIFGTSEENGSGDDIAYYLKKEKPPVFGFTPDAEYPAIFAEKGICRFTIAKEFKNKSEKIKVEYIKAGERVNIVPNYCEAMLKCANYDSVQSSLEEFKKSNDFKISLEKCDDKVKVKVDGIAAHGSTPHLGKNAIMHTILFLNTLDIDADVKDLIDFMSKKIGLLVNGENFGVGFEDEPSGKLTFNVGIIELDEEKSNVRIDIRYPVTVSYETLEENLRKTANEVGAVIENVQQENPLYFPKDHTLIKSLQAVYTNITGDDRDPIAIGGGTYAKAMPNTVAFGPCFPGKPDVIHQANEYIEVEELILNAKIYGNAIYELAK